MNDSCASLCRRSADLYLGAEEIEMGASNKKPSKPLLELTSINAFFIYVTLSEGLVYSEMKIKL